MNAPISRFRTLLGLGLIVVTLLASPGCEQDQPVLDDPTAETLSALRYPGLAEYGPDLDVVVTRSGSHIRLINRTATRYEGMQLWLNQQYVQQAQAIEIGDNPQLHLATFINRHREPFPTGTFLQPDRARAVISMELYDPAANVRYRLTVQPDQDALRL